MAKLLRLFRFEILNNNRIGKYFLYALGEIILVVIGILLALFINNSNEKRNKQKHSPF